MALGRNERTDGSRRTPSSYCSTPVFIFFVAFGLVGVWMITSSNVVPLQEFSQDDKPNEADAPADKMKGNAKIDVPQHQTNSDVPGNQNISHKTTQDTNKKDVEEKLEKESPDNKSKIDNENDGDGKGQDGDSNMGDEDSNTDNGQINMEGGETNINRLAESEESSNERKQGDEVEGQAKENVSENQDKRSESSGDDTGLQTEILNETTTQNGAWPTQSVESKNENEVLQSSGNKNKVYGYNWKVCNVTAGPDYIPCLDNWAAIKRLPTTKHYEHRERHCPEQAPTCLVSLPQGYRQPIKWPQSRDKVWYFNVPHPKLAEIKGHQNWVKVSGEYLTFPGGGTQFKRGAPHYIEFIEEIMPDIGWGKQTRVVLDVGCGVASFGGHLLDKDVLTMSLAPKDEHEAQVQFALERGIPAILAVMGTKRLPFPGRVFDLIHCARCRVPWHIDGGQLLLELNRLLRPGGYFVWSATPIYKKSEEDVGIWQAMSRLTKKMCWELVMIRKDTVNSVGIAIYRKPSSNECYEKRQENEPPLCQESDDPNAAWNVLLQACMHKVPVDASQRGSQWPEQWAVRLEKPPYWLENSQLGVYGKAAPEDFLADYQHWKRIVTNSYLNGMGISWSSVRNVMDMRSVYGGFAAALKDLKVWVMNVVPIDSPDTLPIIYERGLFGIYHDWCESFNTYPRSYDLLHADHLFSKLKKRCNLVGVIAEVDRILRPEGKLIIRDNAEIISELEIMAKSLHWEIRLTYTKDKEGFLCVQKTLWRPKEVETIVSAIA